ncbi:Hypothetical protein CINCED_3A006457 [Cinara cedri]|uniref:Uncharacterized protein n=1 Tax=Cinara cedri TaxID=506608 RepID=A0A5E4NJF8_9HEMI|nr:Hypothetical protein CINCED_3A006457 [Cinara cedri]
MSFYFKNRVATQRNIENQWLYECLPPVSLAVPALNLLCYNMYSEVVAVGIIENGYNTNLLPTIGQCGYDRQLDNKLTQLVPNGMISFKDRTAMDDFRLKAEKRDMHMTINAMFNLRKKLMSWETKMVLCGILDPSLVNRHVLDHPVVIQRKALGELIVQNQKKTYKKIKKGKRKLTILEKIEKEYCKETMTDANKLGISFNKIPFGTSIICDYHEHGKNLKKKIYQHNKDVGLHMPRSNRNVPRFRDVDVEDWKKMPLNTLEDHRKWHAVGLKIIAGQYNGRYIM